MQIPITYLDYVRRYVPTLDRMIDEVATGSTRGRALLAGLHGTHPASVKMAIAAAVARRSGGDAYVLTKALQEEFAEAELPRELTVDELALPSPCVWVGFEGCDIALFGGPGTGYLKVAGAFVLEPQASSDFGVDWEVEGNDEPAYMMAMWAPAIAPVKDPADDAFFMFGFTRGELEDVEAALVNRMRNRPRSSDISLRTGRPIHESKTAEDNEREFEGVLRGTRYLLNMLLHLNMQQRWVSEDVDDENARREALVRSAERVGDAKAKKRLRRAERMSRYRYIVLDMPAPPPVETTCEYAKTDRTVRDHWRKGHYRRVWSGPRIASDGTRQKGTRCEMQYIQRVWVVGSTGEPVPQTTRIVTR